MKIELKIDYNGTPQIDLSVGASGEIDANLLKHFIRLATENGIEFERASSSFAYIKIKEAQR